MLVSSCPGFLFATEIILPLSSLPLSEIFRGTLYIQHRIDVLSGIGLALLELRSGMIPNYPISYELR